MDINCSKEVVSPWRQSGSKAGNPKRLFSLSFGVFKTWLNKALSNLAWPHRWSCSEQAAELAVSWTWSRLCFYDCDKTGTSSLQITLSAYTAFSKDKGQDTPLVNYLTILQDSGHFDLQAVVIGGIWLDDKYPLSCSITALFSRTGRKKHQKNSKVDKGDIIKKKNKIHAHGSKGKPRTSLFSNHFPTTGSKVSAHTVVALEDKHDKKLMPSLPPLVS